MVRDYIDTQIIEQISVVVRHKYNCYPYYLTIKEVIKCTQNTSCNEVSSELNNDMNGRTNI